MKPTIRIEKGQATLFEIAPGIHRIDGFFPPDVLAIQTSREGGASVGPYSSFNLGSHVGDQPSAVSQNRARLANHCHGLPVWLSQVHGVEVACVDSPVGLGLEDAPRVADASIAKNPGVICVVLTADCLPVLVARPSTGQVSAIHAGWRGLCDGVIEAALDRMIEQAARPSLATMTAPPSADEIQEDWYFWLGPAIGQQAFEVGNEVMEAFVQVDAAAKSAFLRSQRSDTKWHADLKELAVQRISAWFSRQNPTSHHRVYVADENRCVFHDAVQYFSYRRDRITGRMASLISRISGGAEAQKR